MRTAASPSRGLHVMLWIVQVVLAAMFGMAGVLKLTQSIAVLEDQTAWVAAVPP
jgi:putative oxidoreductase